MVKLERCQRHRFNLRSGSDERVLWSDKVSDGGAQCDSEVSRAARRAIGLREKVFKQTHVHKESQDPFFLKYPANGAEHTAAKKGEEL